MEYTVENLEQAVAIFYRTEANQQADAHQWLTKAQNSSEAWSFVWELLSPQRSFQVQFFAATTLHTKLMKYWNEVPEDHYESLKKRILDAIISYAMGQKIVLNRLCIAFSAYVIHTIPTHWPNAFEEIVSSFQPHNLPTIESERVIWILLEILTVIPEEFQSTTLSVSQRNRVKAVLQEVSKDILKVVEMCLMPIPSKGFDMSNLITYLHATKCGSAWMTLGGLVIDECSSVCNLLIDLICFVYWNKLDPECISGEEMELIEVAVEAVTTIIQHPHTSMYKNHVIKYTENILYKFEKIIEAERNAEELNKDVVANLYGLIIALADTHSKIFIDNLKLPNLEDQRISFDLFTSILKCTNLKGNFPVDESSSNLTFGFWFTLQDDVLSLETADSTQLLLMIKPFYRDLICILLKKSMLSWMDDTSWPLDDREVFRCYRQDVSDTYMYCYNVLNLEMLDILTSKLNEALCKETETGFVHSPEWTQIETCLHAFCAIAESIEMENLYLPKLMMTIKEIPYRDLNIKVMSTALETVGAYSEWLTDHPDQLNNVMPLVISALGTPEISTSSTMALKDITHSCQKFLLPYVDHILLATQAAFQSGAFKLGECKRLMFSIGKVLSIMPVNRIMDYLNVTLAPTFEEIQNIVEHDPTPSTALCLMSRMKVLSALFNSLYVASETNIEQPVFLIMKNTMPLYKTMAEKYCRNNEVIMDLSVLLKYVVTTLKDDCKPLIEDILQIVVTVYGENPQDHVLVVAKTVLILFGREAELQNLNKQLVQEICNRTLQTCAQYSTNNQLSEISDLLEGFYSFLSILIKKVPQLIFNSAIDTAALFQCAILCLVLPETQTLKAVSSFLVNFINHSRDVSQGDIIQTYGEGLVIRILLNLGSTAPRASLDVLSDIILVLNKKYCDNLYRWLTMLLAQENFPTARITSEQKEAFIKVVLRSKTNKRKLSDSVLEFALICRGILKQGNNLP
ncbi:importin-13 [Sitophilus oryzae]|uniref:Importin-13 n=1 Tax=Sitophilus oryzae TaxID=7048 RepID=A0A6J2YE23_SITOR|nr:importin-13 [Sitophilus oryzae]